MEGKRSAVVLSSGGLDSTTAMGVAREEGFELCALSFDYGQRHRCELEAAERVARFFGLARRIVLKIDLRVFGHSALTAEIDVPKDRSGAAMGAGIPVTYVPARNTIFLSFALAWAETLGVGDIFIGVNAVDYSGYPDCRPEFIEAFERMANLGAKAAIEATAPVRIHAPLIALTKAEIIRKGLALGLDYSLTRSCYDPDEAGAPCGHCDSCQLRLRGFREAGLEDPLEYPRGKAL